ncbi:MAG: pantoate--beta-alanine ligase, partial [Planctomycetia bacterium]|nr:pantoate--beta-alanine ligase [Planctomycetia bacterium]
MALKRVTSVSELTSAIGEAKREGRRIGLVPTMGALHEGHLSLVRQSRQEGCFTIVSVYVNPTQFGPHEDFTKYPRTPDADCRLLEGAGADLVFMPTDAILYPEKFATWVEPGGAALKLEGACRPGHFRGVATVVLKLFTLTRPDIAFFGQKDYQQVLVIRNMVRDFHLPIVVRACPIVRESDGLAMSSRNAYLSPVDRCRSAAISQSLAVARLLLSEGQRDAQTLLCEMEKTLRNAGITEIDYLVITDPETLEPVVTIQGPVVALVAVHVGTTR